ncbi:MAG: YhdT family protein [Paraclostridium sp.]|uniref:YhdT family protein n=1 Tax=Paraclostridium sp. TaxID=2023273 RepID=UPI003F31699A
MKENEKEFEEDPRYKQCNKEAKMGLILGIVNLIWWFGFGYGLGSKPVEEYSYMFGFPSWFFMSCIVGGVLFSILTVIMINKFFKNMSLDALDEDEVKAYRKEYK